MYSANFSIELTCITLFVNVLMEKSLMLFSVNLTFFCTFVYNFLEFEKSFKNSYDFCKLRVFKHLCDSKLNEIGQTIR